MATGDLGDSAQMQDGPGGSGDGLAETELQCELAGGQTTSALDS